MSGPVTASRTPPKPNEMTAQHDAPAVALWERLTLTSWLSRLLPVVSVTSPLTVSTVARAIALCRGAAHRSCSGRLVTIGSTPAKVAHGVIEDTWQLQAGLIACSVAVARGKGDGGLSGQSPSTSRTTDKLGRILMLRVGAKARDRDGGHGGAGRYATMLPLVDGDVRRASLMRCNTWGKKLLLGLLCPMGRCPPL